MSSKNNGGGSGGSRSSHQQDPRLDYHLPLFWQNDAAQHVLSSQYIVVEPNEVLEAAPKQVDFDVPSMEPLLFGPMTKFRVKGTFQKLEKNAATWTNVPSTDVDKVLLCFNWLDFLIQECSVYHDNTRVASSTENRFVAPFINTYLYSHMNSMAKNQLCPQLSHPGRCVPAPNAKWSKDAEAWTAYAKSAFTGGPISFDYTPLGMFPFFQGSGGSTASPDSIPRILPVPDIGKLCIRFAFTDSQHHIFKRLTEENAETQYRFSFSQFKLVLETVRLSSAMERQLHPLNRPLAFPGTTRIQLIEHVTAGSTSWRARFQNIYLPEALFICCLSKASASKPHPFSTVTDSTAVFAAHNLESLELSFDGQRFSVREPQIGTFRWDELDAKSMQDHLAVPPFGIAQNPKNITSDYVANGSSQTAFPHIYVPLVMGPDRQRRVPWTTHAEDYKMILSKKADLDIDLRFTEANSPADTVVVVFATYSDVNIVFDPKTRHFSSPYFHYMN
jgi:hypothetical protein